MPLITPEEYMTFIGSDKDPTPQIVLLCDAVSLVVENFIGRQLEYKERVEYHSGDNSSFLYLKVRPVHSISEVALDFNGFWENDGSSFDNTSILNPGDYALKKLNDADPAISGLLYRVKGFWTEPIRMRLFPKLVRDYQGTEIGNIRVTYIAGYDPIPMDIKLACAQIITRVKNSYLKHGGPLMKEHLGDWLYQLSTTELKNPELGSARQILSKYREVLF